MVGTNIQRLIGMHLLSQSLLAKELGMSRQAIHNLTSGSSMPSTRSLIAISEFFGITPNDLLSDAQTCLRTAVEGFESAPAKSFAERPEH
jgi:transcriptional regulator with XRE-family HTH domain